MSNWLRIVSVALLSGMASLGGLLIAIFVTHCKEDALRGGALGTALALIFTFTARNYGMRLYNEAKRLTALAHEVRPVTEASPVTPPVPSVQELADRIETLQAAVVVDGDELVQLNWWVIFTTGIAAIVCAFGDLIAARFITPPACH